MTISDVGLLTPIVAPLLVAQAIVIVARAHWANGFFTTNGGYEFPLMLGVTAGVIGLLGPRSVSLDAAIGLEPSLAVRTLLVIAGIIVGATVLEIPAALAEWTARGGLRRT